jgi:predicted metal-binding protein
LKKIGIIRCHEQSLVCPGNFCFPSMRDKTGTFADYDAIDLVGFDTCGGCGRGKSDKIVAHAQKLKDRGAEVIHLGTCMVGHCPWKDQYAKDIAEKVAVTVVQRTHPQGPRPAPKTS